MDSKSLSLERILNERKVNWKQLRVKLLERMVNNSINSFKLKTPACKNIDLPDDSGDKNNITQKKPTKV